MYMEDSLSKPLGDVLKIMQDRIHNIPSTYFGIKCMRSPVDFWIYQEIIHSLQPDIIVEIGSCYGASALALAHLCDNIGKGRVVTIELERPVNPKATGHPRVTLLKGNACDQKIISQVKAHCFGAKSVLIIEDSSHTYSNTTDVLNEYSKIVTVGSYMIVEDSICHHGLDVGPNPGPYEAITDFLSKNDNFLCDRSRESFLITWNPKGYLKRLS